MRKLWLIICAAALIILVAGFFTSCGSNGLMRASAPLINNSANLPDGSAAQQSNTVWPALPADKAQPWEKLDGAGRVVSSINLQSQFIPGVERFAEAGLVDDFGEASAFTSGGPGDLYVSWAIYRIPMGADQPGTIAADANLRLDANGITSAYYIGVGDYSVNTWHWYGPFSVSHVRFNVPPAAYTSGLGNLMLAVVAYDGADFDLVGLGVNARDGADIAPPPTPSAPTLTPVAGGVLAEWIPVVEADLAGYRIYADGKDAFNYIEGGTSAFIPATADVSVTISSVDVSGNESAQSSQTIAAPLTGTVPAVQLTASSASGMRGDVISLTATGADSYDWDTDGDGTWEITDETTGSAFAVTADMGIIRPALRAHSAGDGFWMGAVSLIIAGNSRPVVSVTATPQSGPSPLEVSFIIEAEDADGEVTDYAEDFDGDGIWDHFDPFNPSPIGNIYIVPGTYNAKFRVTDNEGAWDVDTVAIQVFANQPPVAALWADTPSGDAPLTVEFDATGSYDPDGIVFGYYWDFDGDGLFNEPGEEESYQNYLIVTRQYPRPGYYSVGLRVTDLLGAASTQRVNVAAHGWDNQIVDGFGGESSSLCIVNGNPAIAYYDPSNWVVRYVRAADKYGISWNPPVNVTLIGSSMYKYTSLGIVNGLPAIAFKDELSGNLMFARAVDVNGTAWSGPITIDGEYDAGNYASMAIVNGNPAIAYRTNAMFPGYLLYVRAQDPDGTSWNAPMAVAGIGNFGYYASLAVVNGYPAISYEDADMQELKYVIAADVDGNTWYSPVTVDTTYTPGMYSSLAVVNGMPAIAYCETTYLDAKFVRASDPYGTSWGYPATIDAGQVGYYTVLTVICGYPAVVYEDMSDYTIKYIRAADADGANWGYPAKITGGSITPTQYSLTSVGGYPAIAYLENNWSDLGFIRLY